MKLKNPRQIFKKNTQIFMKIRPEGAELFRTHKQTDRHDNIAVFAILRKRLTNSFSICLI